MRRRLPPFRAMILVAVVLLAMGLRGVYSAGHADRLVGDAATYHRLGKQLMEDGYLGYSSTTLRSWRPPLYPTFLAGVYAVFGPSPLPGKLANALLAGLTTLLIAWIGRRLGSTDAGLAGALAFALYGHEIRHAAQLYPETLLAALVALLVALEHAPRATTRLRSLGQGVLVGVAMHLQPALATVAVFLAIRRLLGGADRRVPAAAGLLLLGTALAIVPWTVRNHRVHGEFVFMTTNGGFNLLRGHNDFADGGRLSPEGVTWVSGMTRKAPEGRGEPAFDRWFRARALDWMRENPGRTAVNALGRARSWWLPSHLLEPGSKWPVTYGLLFPFALIGVWSCLRAGTPLAPTLLTILAASIPSVLIVYAGQRYRSPVIPLVALLAGFGAVAVWEYARRRLEASPQAR